MKILINSLAGIGDTLMATPLIRQLRLEFPQALIDVLVLWPGSKQVLEHNPHLNHVFQINMVKEPPFKILSYLRRLRKLKYDISLNTYPQSKTEYRIVARFIGARQRLSHRYSNFIWLDRFLVNAVCEEDYSKHCIENNLNLLNLLGKQVSIGDSPYELFLQSEELAWAERFVLERKLIGKRLIGFHPGSGVTKNLAARRWPLYNYVRLVMRLLEQEPDVVALFFGDPEEVAEYQTLRERLDRDRFVIAETKSIREAAALLTRCQLFVSVDTALMHLAAAVRVPHQILIETPTTNKTVEPYGRPYKLVANPAVHGRTLDYYRYDGRGIRGTNEELTQIMRSVSVEDVLITIRSELKDLKHAQTAQSLDGGLD